MMTRVEHTGGHLTVHVQVFQISGALDPSTCAREFRFEWFKTGFMLVNICLAYIITAFGLSMRCRTFVSGWRIVGTVLTIDSINDLWTAWEKQNSTQLQSEIAAFWIGAMIVVVFNLIFLSVAGTDPS